MMLTRERERELLLDRDNPKSEELLVRAYIPLVRSIARRFRTPGTPAYDDAVQEGLIGLVKAIRGFDLNLDNRLGTYAQLWIKQYIIQYAVKNTSIVSLSYHASIRAAFLNYSKAKAALGIFHNITSSDVPKLSERLKISHDDVITLESIHGGDMSLNNTFGESTNEFVDLLADMAPTPEEILVKKDEIEGLNRRVAEALENLKPAERQLARVGMEMNDSAAARLCGSTAYKVNRAKGRLMRELRRAV